MPYDAGSAIQDIDLQMKRKAVDAVRRKLGAYRRDAIKDQQIEIPYTQEELDRYIIFTLMDRANPYTDSHGDNLNLSRAHSILASRFSHQDAEALARTYTMLRPGTMSGQRDAIDYRLREMSLPTLPKSRDDIAYILGRFQGNC